MSTPDMWADPDLEATYSALGAAIAAHEHPLVLTRLAGDLAAVLVRHDVVASIQMTLTATTLAHVVDATRELDKLLHRTGYGKPDAAPDFDAVVARYRAEFRPEKKD